LLQEGAPVDDDDDLEDEEEDKGKKGVGDIRTVTKKTPLNCTQH